MQRRALFAPTAHWRRRWSKEGTRRSKYLIHGSEKLRRWSNESVSLERELVPLERELISLERELPHKCERLPHKCEGLPHKCEGLRTGRLISLLFDCFLKGNAKGAIGGAVGAKRARVSHHPRAVGAKRART